MFLALKEFRYEKLRYSLIVVMFLLISYLIFILTGLAFGLANQNTNAINNWHFKQIVLNQDANVNLNQSLLTKEMVATLPQNAHTALIGQASIVVKKPHHANVGASFIGLKPQQFIYRNLKLTAGKMPTNSHQLVVDENFKNSGYHLNDTVTLNSLKDKFKIVGFVKNHQYNVAPVAYGRLTAWQNLKNVGPNFTASALLSKQALHLKATNLKTYSVTQLINKLPGYSAQNLTFALMIGFLLVISLIIIAVFLYIITIQKLPNYAVLRAQGIPAKTLVATTIIQAMLLALSGTILGGLLTWLSALFIPKAAPIFFDPLALGLVAAGLLFASLLGSLLPVRTILKVDPVTVINS